MKIRYETVILNKQNISQYVTDGAILNGSHTCSWSFAENKPEQPEIIIYHYEIAPSLNLNPNGYLYRAIQYTNNTKEKTLTHEMRHDHNTKVGSHMNMSGAVCYTYIMLYVLDEISARIAAEIYDIKNHTTNNISNKVLKFIGAKTEDIALLHAMLQIYDTSDYYCERAASFYKDNFTAAFNDVATERSLLAQNAIYRYGKKAIRTLHTTCVKKCTKHYFTFDGEYLLDKINPTTKVFGQILWSQLENKILIHAKKCVKNMLK